MSRLVLICLLVAGPVWAQSAPTISWQHAGTSTTRFEAVVDGDTATRLVVDLGLPTPTGDRYTASLPTLPAGAHTVGVRACGAGCSPTGPTVTVVALEPAPATTYYIDPDYGGGNGASDGSAARPWTSLGTTQWTAINAALATGSVTVYGSAREAGSATAETLGGALMMQRSDASTHRLTFDGMTFYNTNDAAPSSSTWVPTYSTTYKMQLTNGGSSLALGWAHGDGAQDYITLRGFEASGNISRVAFGGSHLVVEHLYVHDITGNGAAVTLLYGNYDEASCAEDIGHFDDVVIRFNRIERTYGEALYIGGNNHCTVSPANQHSNILIESNVIVDAGANGGQGDGIDLKDGLTNVTVRGNIITNARNGGMTLAGGYGGDQNYLIEWNTITGSVAEAGILIGSSWGDPQQYVFRHNVIQNNTLIGIKFSGLSGLDIDTMTVQYNTLTGNGTYGLYAANVDYLTALNNLIFSNYPASPNLQMAVTTGVRDSGTALSDYNLFSPGLSDSNANAISGGHNTIQANPAGLTVDASNPGTNLTVPAAPGVPSIQ